MQHCCVQTMKVFLSVIAVLVVTDCSWAAKPSEEEVVSAFQKAKEINELKRDLDLIDRALDARAPSKCPMSLVHGKRLHSDAKADRKVNNALLATRILTEKGKHTLKDLSHHDVRELFKRVNGDSCAIPDEPTDCDFTSTYRRADGACNNEANTIWGMAGISQERLVTNAYEDELGLPRTTGSTADLPNPREVSNAMHRNKNEDGAADVSGTLNLHSMGFGQFLDHDITLTPEQSAVSDCCDGENPSDTDNCFNIVIASDDEFQPILEKDYCMEVKRSAPVLCADSTSNDVAVRQQKNSITSFIDASNVYGSSETRQKQLRVDGTGYLLATTKNVNGKERILDGNDADCTLTKNNQQCSAAGDVRVNELPNLTAYHYLFLKEHNRIAEKIKGFYIVDDTVEEHEKVFQETRRILIAIIQKITYNEFLASFLSSAAMSKYSLSSTSSYTYEPETNPTILNAFSTAAYRMGHSWISQKMVLFENDLKTLSSSPDAKTNTEDNFHDPKMTYLPNAFRKLSYWLSGAPSPETDRVIEEAVRNSLFINVSANLVWDLAAVNIQRGRDHGLGSYAEYVKWCTDDEVKETWVEGALPYHNSTTAQNLQNAGYESPLDIDLFTGGLTEQSVSGGNLGPTFECIIGEQFRRLKFGDRLWYQNSDAGFTTDQLATINNYSYSKLLCNNYKYNEVQHPNAFLRKDPKKKCTDIPDRGLDFKKFNPNAKQKPLSLDERLETLIEELEKEDE